MTGGGRHRALTSPSLVRELLRADGIRPARTLGQNFLVDANVLGIIEEAARLSPTDTVIEVGAGLGALTEVLIKRCGEVFSVETDRRLCGIIERELGARPNFTLVNADAAKLKLDPLRAEMAWDEVKMVSNLPYRVAATLVIDWLRKYPWITSYTVMVQREIADRLSASPGSGDYSAASVKAGYRSHVERVAGVSRNCFYPRPQVDSALLRLERYGAGVERERPGPAALDERFFDSVVGAAFSQRRKKLANSLASEPGLSADRKRVCLALEELGIAAGARAEELSPDQFILLSNALLAGQGD